MLPPSPPSLYVASGKTAEVTVPYGKLKPGTTYTFHTSAYDGSLYETTWSPWAKFRIRSRSVDIKLPEPDKNAPKVDLDAYQEPQEGRPEGHLPGRLGSQVRQPRRHHRAGADTEQQRLGELR
ncbi:hypothetical protein GCM10009574_078970 [Streptomyces asiaticus]|uniref:Purple acid phosphatase N-terminal domain-containing protein n=1 Tax=Streptomyces rhizosphaericus TaxID=114699 RepID=A0ABP3ZD93_9ACTN